MKNYQKMMKNLGVYKFPVGITGFDQIFEYDIKPLECQPYLMLANYDNQIGFICTDPRLA